MDTLPGPVRPPDSEEEAASSPPAREYEDTLREETAEDVGTRDTLPDTGKARLRARRQPAHPPPPPRLRDLAAVRAGRPLSVEGEPRLARDLMTRQILTIGPDDPILMLEEHMESFRFRHLPVVEGDVLVGLISHSDLLHASSSRLSANANEENEIIHQLPAWRIMRQGLVTVRPMDPLERVAALLWETRVGCLPVTEEDGTLVGIITEGDFVRLTHHFLTTGEPMHPKEATPDRTDDDRQPQ
jgi:CBS domain-containing membrane protein